MEYQDILYTKQDGIATITINRPAQYNAFRAQTCEEMIHALGKDPDEASQDERLAAYARVSARGATGAELLLMLEASTDSELSKPWKRVITRWVPDPASIDPTDPRALQKMVAYLAADGLWLSESVGAIPLPHQLRAALAEHLARSVADADELPSNEANQ